MSANTKTIPDVQCECGHITGDACNWSGPREQTVVVEWMPPCWRASHAAAGNGGSYPANGAMRLRVERSCAELICDDDWTFIVGNTVGSVTVKGK